MFNKDKKTDIWKIDPRKVIVIPENNARTDYGTEEQFESLVQSIIENGVQEPIRCRRENGEFTLVHGYRRMRAVHTAIDRGVEIQYVPAIAVRRGYSPEDELFDHFTLNTGKPLTTLEEANLIRRLINYGYNQSEIAKRIGKTDAHVSNMVVLAKSPKELQNHVQEGNVSATSVIKTVRQSKGDTQQAKETINSEVKKAKSNGKKKAVIKTISYTQQDMRAMFEKGYNHPNLQSGETIDSAFAKIIGQWIKRKNYYCT